ncbi:hypothetical protein P148_SR1C00001G0243 [candidate division SR1 bacterium RAAC1_SR1_1]|nr:hypothetical protein P148_SR1C00001G0243 [candidate division SR1 bacterium RAAC1_SR1_1]
MNNTVIYENSFRTDNLIVYGNSEELKKILLELEKLMYGYNYEINLGFVKLPECSTIALCKDKLETIFVAQNPHKVWSNTEGKYDLEEENKEIIPASIGEFWKKFDNGFNDRGEFKQGERPSVNETEERDGLLLSEENEKKLYQLVDQYKTIVSSFISPASEVYHYLGYNTIPGYETRRGYRMIIVNKDRDSIFIYGSGSD